MKNRQAVRTVTRSSGHKYLLFRYAKGEFIKIPLPSAAALERAIVQRERALAAMRLELSDLTAE